MVHTWVVWRVVKVECDLQRWSITKALREAAADP